MWCGHGASEGVCPLLVTIDAGHGGRDPGACANGLRESDVVLEIAKLTAAGIRASGVHVRLTRTEDTTLPVAERVRLITAPSDCVVSIHANAAADSTARGHEVFVSASFAESQRLGWAISDRLLWTAIPPRNPRVKERRTADGLSDYYYVIRHPTRAGIPAVLVEVGFLTNTEDADLLRGFWGRFAVAHALTRGILNYLRVPEVGELQARLAEANATLERIRTTVCGEEG